MVSQPSEAIQSLTERLRQIQIEESQKLVVEEEKKHTDNDEDYEDMIDEEDELWKHKRQNNTRAETRALLKHSHKITKSHTTGHQTQFASRQKVRKILMEAYKYASAGNHRLQVRQELENRGILKSMSEFYAFLNKFRLKIPHFNTVREAFSVVIPCSQAVAFKQMLFLFYEKSQRAMGHEPEQVMTN